MSDLLDGYCACGAPLARWLYDHCPRCAELAALEREIGRAVIDILNADSAIDKIDEVAARTLSWDDFAAGSRLRAVRRQLRKDQDALITRYCALLAAGAEK